jgi:hypothetical protein
MTGTQTAFSEQRQVHDGLIDPESGAVAPLESEAVV